MPPLPPVHQKMWTSAHPPIPQGPGSEQPLGPSPQRIGCGKSMLCYAFFRVMTFLCWTRVLWRPGIRAWINHDLPDHLQHLLGKTAKLILTLPNY